MVKPGHLLKRWKGVGYRIEIVYLRISSPQLALRRITARVKQGGHNVPRADVIRRFTRSWNNFDTPIVFWRMTGACMIIRQLHRGCWNKDHETYSGKERNEGILRRRWTRTAARRQGRAQDRPHARHADLHLEERQSRRRKTVTLRLGRLNVARCSKFSKSGSS